MIKKIVACFLLISLILSFSLVFSAAKSECTEKQVAVYFDGVYKQETVLVEEGNVYVPVFWLQYYGLMNYSEEGEYYKFYYPDQEKNGTFAKRIYINKDGSGFDIRYYEDNSSFFEDFSQYRDWIKNSIDAIEDGSLESLREVWNITEKNLNDNHSDFKNSFSVLSNEFSSSLNVDGQLFVPLTELLPLMNAKVAISENGEICIFHNYVSLSQALYDLKLGSLVFDADVDVEYDEFLSAAAWISDTIFSWRFDRLNFVTSSGKVADYEEVFKNLLVEDDVFLSLYDQSVTPKDSEIERLSAMFHGGDTVLEILKAGKMTMDGIKIRKEVYPTIYTVLFGDESAGLDFGVADVVEGAAKIFDYQNTYQNQIEDHRNMLDAVYGYNKYKGTPPQRAAKNVEALYGEKYLNKVLPAVQTTFRDFINGELASSVGKKVTPYAVALTVTKFIKPKEFETVHNSSLLYVMDSAAKESYDVFLSRKYSNDFSTEALKDLRLSAMMALVVSRYAYSTLWEGEHEKIAKIDDALKKIYLCADGVECDSSDYYGKTKVRLEKSPGLKKILADDSDNPTALSGTYVSESGRYEVEFFEDFTCIWYQEIRGETVAFYGTYEKKGNNYVLHMKGGLYSYDTDFDAVPSSDGLIVTGGVVYEELFVKTTGNGGFGKPETFGVQDLIGTWEGIMEDSSSVSNVILTFGTDGMYHIKVSGEQNYEFSEEYSFDGTTLIVAGDQEQPFEYKDGILTFVLDKEKELYMILTKNGFFFH